MEPYFHLRRLRAANPVLHARLPGFISPAWIAVVEVNPVKLNHLRPAKHCERNHVCRGVGEVVRLEGFDDLRDRVLERAVCPVRRDKLSSSRDILLMELGELAFPHHLSYVIFLDKQIPEVLSLIVPFGVFPTHRAFSVHRKTLVKPKAETARVNAPNLSAWDLSSPVSILIL